MEGKHREVTAAWRNKIKRVNGERWRWVRRKRRSDRRKMKMRRIRREG